MTWYAGHIFAQPIEPVIKAMSSVDAFRGHLYHVTDVDGHEWHTPEVIHDLPDGGLLVVRELRMPGNIGPEWFDDDAIMLDSRRLLLSSGSNMVVPSEIQVLTPPLFGSGLVGDSFPAIDFLRLLKWLSISTNSVVSYYYCLMWGGGIEVEYSWVFGPDEVVYLFNELYNVTEYREVGISVDDSVLRPTLQHHGLALPTEYFALHTREFPWDEYKLDT